MKEKKENVRYFCPDCGKDVTDILKFDAEGKYTCPDCGEWYRKAEIIAMTDEERANVEKLKEYGYDVYLSAYEHEIKGKDECGNELTLGVGCLDKNSILYTIDHYNINFEVLWAWEHKEPNYLNVKEHYICIENWLKKLECLAANLK